MIIRIAITLMLGLSVLLSAQPAGVKGFQNPEAARDALIQSLEAWKPGALDAVMGPGAEAALGAGDKVQNEANRVQFLQAYKAKNQLTRDPVNDGTVYLEVGDEEWPLPVPIVKRGNAWFFDVAAAKDEIRHRVIGGNELDAIEICRGYVEAQYQYAEKDRDGDGVLKFAEKIISSQGKKDGLFWEGEACPIPKEFVSAVAEAGYTFESGKLAPYNGYYFRVLKSQGPAAEGGARDYMVKGAMIGGFALVAWPARYGISGIRTFIVSHDGVVFDKDLGQQTDALARAMKAFNPDESWREQD